MLIWSRVCAVTATPASNQTKHPRSGARVEASHAGFPLSWARVKQQRFQRRRGPSSDDSKDGAGGMRSDRGYGGRQTHAPTLRRRTVLNATVPLPNQWPCGPISTKLNGTAPPPANACPRIVREQGTVAFSTVDGATLGHAFVTPRIPDHPPCPILGIVGARASAALKTLLLDSDRLSGNPAWLASTRAPTVDARLVAGGCGRHRPPRDQISPVWSSRGRSDHPHRQHPGRADAVLRPLRDPAPQPLPRARAGRPQPRLVGRRADAPAPLSQDFKDHGHTLEDEKPDVLIAAFGFNESFAGPAGLAKFQKRPRETSSARRRRPSTTARRPAAGPALADRPGRPDEPAHHRRQEEQREHQALHRRDGRARPTSTACCSSTCSRPASSSCERPDKPLTINGIHLNDDGDRRLGAGARRGPVRPAPGRSRPTWRSSRPRSTRRTCSSSTTTAPSTAATSTAAARPRSASSTSRPSSPSSAR